MAAHYFNDGNNVTAPHAQSPPASREKFVRVSVVALF